MGGEKPLSGGGCLNELRSLAGCVWDILIHAWKVGEGGMRAALSYARKELNHCLIS